MLNRLEGVVFERLPQNGNLRQRYCFAGSEGDVGACFIRRAFIRLRIRRIISPRRFIYFHRITRLAEAFAGYREGPAPATQDRYGSGLRQRTELAMVEILGRSGGAEGAEILDRLFIAALTGTKLAICKAIARSDPQRDARIWCSCRGCR